MLFFLSKGGSLKCKVTGKRQYSIDVPQGGLEIPCLLTFKSDSPSDIVKISKLINNIPIDDDKTNDIIEPDIKKQKIDDSFVKSENINLDETKDPSGDIWVSLYVNIKVQLVLSKDDKEALSYGRMLNDKLINFAQRVRVNFTSIY